MERKNPIDYNLLIWAGIAYVALRSSAVQGLLGGLSGGWGGGGGPGGGGYGASADQFTLLRAERTPIPGPSTANLDVFIQLGHKGPGGAANPFKIAVWGDKGGGTFGRTVGWYGDMLFTFNEDASEQSYDLRLTLGPRANNFAQLSGTWDITVQVQTASGSKKQEFRVPSAIVW